MDKLLREVQDDEVDEDFPALSTGGLIKWAVKKYKRFKKSMHKAGDWIRNLAKCYPGFFVHWQYGFQYRLIFCVTRAV